MYRRLLWIVLVTLLAAPVVRAQIGFGSGNNRPLLAPRTPAAFMVTDNVSGVGDTYLRLQRAGHPRLLLALGDTSKRLYTLAEGAKQWSLSSSTKALSAVWALSDGTLLAYTTTANKQLWRSVNDGVDWTQVMGDGLVSTPQFSTNGYLQEWALVDGGGGYALLCEYGAAADDSGRYAFMTKDGGLTWTTVLDSTVPTTPWMHIHGGVYHRGTSKWVLGMGDGVRARVVTLDREGTGYAELLPPICRIQPISLIDYGSATDVVATDDGIGQVIKINVLTGAVTPVVLAWDTEAINPPYSWALAYQDGVFYASQYTQNVTAPVRPESTILAANSVDGPWVKIATLPVTVQGCQTYAGYRNGLLHWQTKTAGANTAGHFALRPLKPPALTWTAVNPQRTNSCVSGVDSAHDGSRWAANHATLGTSATGGIDGGACVSAVTDASGIAVTIYNGFAGTSAATAGNYYQVSLWVKPDKLRVIYIQPRVSEAGYANATLVNDEAGWLCPPNVWTRISTRGFKMPTSGVYIGVYLTLTTDNNASGDPTTMLIDQYLTTAMPGPTTYVASGSNVAAVQPTSTIAARPAWTEVFWFKSHWSWWAFSHRGDSCTTPFYIRSWKVGSTIAELSYIPAVESTLSGSQTTAITAATGIFRPEMVGEMIVARTADRTGGTSITKGLITSYTDSTHVASDTNFSARLAGERVYVIAPYFQLTVTDGGTTDTLYSPRAAILKDGPMAFAVNAGGASDSKVRAWVVWDNGWLPFTRDGTNEGSSHDWTALLNATVSVSYSRPYDDQNPDLVGLPGAQAILGTYGLLTRDDLTRLFDVVPDALRWSGK